MPSVYPVFFSKLVYRRVVTAEKKGRLFHTFVILMLVCLSVFHNRFRYLVLAVYKSGFRSRWVDFVVAHKKCQPSLPHHTEKSVAQRATFCTPQRYTSTPHCIFHNCDIKLHLEMCGMFTSALIV